MSTVKPYFFQHHFGRRMVAAIERRQGLARQDQRRAVAGRQHKAIAVGPVRAGGMMLEKAIPQHIGHWCGAQRQAGVAGVGFLDHIDGQKAQRIDAFPVKFFAHLHSSGRTSIRSRSSGKSVVDDVAGFIEQLLQMILALETFGVDLVDRFGA